MTLIPAIVAATALVDCSESTSAKDPVPGAYTAIIFTTTTSGVTLNQLQLGSSLQITLNENGTTSGHLHLAAVGTQPAFDADLTGTWTRNGDTIRFTQAADTFVRDLVLTIQTIAGNEFVLVGDQIFSGTRVNLTLAH